MVEQNRDAQVTTILKSTLSGALADRLVPITHYNGTPIAAENIVRPILGWEKNPSGPGWPTGNVELDNPAGPHDDERRRMTRRSRVTMQDADADRTHAIESCRSHRTAIDATPTHHRPLRGDRHHGQRNDDPGPEQRPHLHAADGGLSGVAVDAVQGVRPQQHHQLLDRGVQVDRRQSVRDGQDERDRLFEQDAGLLPPVQPRLQRACTAGCRRWRPGPWWPTRKLLCIGVSGDGDTANIGMGQFKHVCRRNVPLVYIIENNGCYGLTKGQFSATADLNQHLRRADRRGERRAPVRPLRRGDRRRARRSWPGRSPATRSRWSRC